MGADFRIVVSSENTSYMAWQTQLFCFSAMTRLGQFPVIIVHGTRLPLREEFRMLQKCGCQVIEAPSFREHPTGLYAPRNELGSLLTVASMADIGTEHILFCEPDMLFVKPVSYVGSLSGEYYSYLNYAEERVRIAAQAFDIAHLLHRLNESGKIGVPYLIPVSCVQRIASRWIQVLDSFQEVQWIDIMYAFGIALAVGNLDASTTRIMNDNRVPLNQVTGSIIHYCYGDERWNKRHFFENRSPFDERVSTSTDERDTILGEILAQIQQATVFFRSRGPLRLLMQAGWHARRSLPHLRIRMLYE